MERSCKSWGEKINLFQNDLCEVSILYLNGGQRCSWHRHWAKWNQFFVIDGAIDVWTNDGHTKVMKGQSFTTQPRQWHEFRTPYGAAVIQEIMYVQYEAEDIERKTMGGPLDG